MKNILLRFLFTLTFSTSIQANLFSNEGYLGKFPYNGISILVNDDYIADEGTDFSIKKHIEDTVKLNDVSPKNPINIVIGEGIKDNQYDFDVFIDYLKNTDAKNIVIEIDDYLEFKNQITFFKHHFLSSSKIESFLTRRLESLEIVKAHFLSNNKIIFFSAIGFENLRIIEKCFLYNNEITLFLSNGLENVEIIDDYFLSSNKIKTFSGIRFISLIRIGNHFLSHNELISFSSQGFENVETLGSHFLGRNHLLKFVDLTNFIKLDSVGRNFLHDCPNIEKIFVTKEKEAFFRQHTPENLQDKIVVKDMDDNT